MTRSSTWRVVLGTAAAFVMLLLLGGIIVIYSGAYNVAASEPHSRIGAWALGTLQKRSVSARADEVPPPPPIDSAMLRHGLEHYVEMCVMCHGAPGVERGEIGRGLTPTPPKLEEEARHLTDREVYWILQHGIKMTGMPAFGETHSPEELWALVAFVRRLPELSPEEYQRLVESAGPGGSSGGAGAAAGHSHGPNAPAHSH